jgi:hypothetical protein
MPGITAEMIDGWFAWHPLHDMRYRIWFPPGHYGTSVADTERCRDSRLGYRERYWHNKHTIIEDGGMGVSKLMIVFVPLVAEDKEAERNARIRHLLELVRRRSSVK